MTDNRTTELLPCPFCGGEAEIHPSNDWNVRFTGATYFAWCDKCETRGDYYNTEAEAIAAWNTRADYHGFEQAAIEAWESIKAWNTRAELGSGTCEWILEHSGTLYDKWRCSECGFLYVSSRCDAGATDFDPNYCPNCGKRVSA